MLGNELEGLTDHELMERVDGISIFVKLKRLQKSRLVKILQLKGHTVGFLGDGINDAGVLKDVDVVISVDTATDIAKESADFILIESDLPVLRSDSNVDNLCFINSNCEKLVH